jgi:WD40 repeat protein|mmetsp:Transcript_49798/g.81269  ORF Transcript_49798/g.81269 Transcript_49798/m.81269 type:complete len:366 (+) Transcript_49798:59-1156(+)|eukprot:CAMPEP_0174286390 /NCGR_PEP_ID=MMETSP0809-20121228/11698_1 /TAXON_ID=73025 ORGANISM="Eutreptiella gymnastica-like, Strain CCMP1594" /NCGR_SAMPLE_ID=MMETSP0809 /ASSEMBLY_ACC=CAM_ASM_000658 /LENGTH=365 /DNA_ID=CAMNT_0015382435 /DNA_START=39 /DNA_END=1136 /DNA_ORIENTATION=+
MTYEEPAEEPVGPLTKHRQQIIEYVRKSLTYTPFETRWIPASNRFIAAGNYARNTGCLIVYQLSRGELKQVHEVEKPHPFKCMTFGQSPLEDRKLATGDFQGNLSIWDIEKFDKPVFTVKAHKSIINKIDGALHSGPPELVTGSRDGSVKVWDARQSEKPVANLEPASADTARDCWCVSFGNSYQKHERVVAAGYDNGDMKIFDLRTMTMKWQTNISNGICHLAFDRPDIEMNKLVLTTLEGRIRVYDMRTFHPTIGYSHLEERMHPGTVWTCATLPQNRDVFMSCANGELALHKYIYPAQRSVQDHDGVKKGVPGKIETLNKVSLSTQPICSFDWNKSRIGLACLALFDQTLRVIITTKLDTVG